MSFQVSARTNSEYFCTVKEVHAWIQEGAKVNFQYWPLITKRKAGHAFKIGNSCPWEKKDQ